MCVNSACRPPAAGARRPAPRTPHSAAPLSPTHSHTQTSTITAANAFMPMGVDNAWDFKEWVDSFQLVIKRLDAEVMEFDMIGALWAGPQPMQGLGLQGCSRRPAGLLLSGCSTGVQLSPVAAVR